MYVRMLPSISAKHRVGMKEEPVQETKTVYRAVFSKIAQRQLDDHQERLEALELQLQRIHNRVTNLEMLNRGFASKGRELPNALIGP